MLGAQAANRWLSLADRVAGRWPDLLNPLIIAAGWVTVLLLLTPRHEYPIIDDWIYARSVQHQLATGAFDMPNQSQSSLVGLTLWGTLWTRLLGFSFTTLTWSTLVLALAALIAFYGIARLVGVAPAGALLAAGLLGLNPIFLHLSYSFMTDVPFLALVLLASLCYLLGLQGRGYVWLWVGGLLAGYSLLIRQFGVLVPLAFLVYLALEGLSARRWRWREMLGIGLVPAVVFAAWYIWARQFPPTGADQLAARLSGAFVFTLNWPGVFLGRALVMLPLVALSAWCAVHFNRRRLGAALVAAWGILLVAGTLVITIPQDSYTFVGYGNILRTGGIDFFEYRQEPIWAPEVWKGLALFGAALAAVMLAKMTEALVEWLPGLRLRDALLPLSGLYFLGAGTFVVTLALLGYSFDRYALTFLPFVILFMIRGSRSWGRLAWTYSLVALVLIGGFTLTAQADFVDHDNARWEAGRWLSARAPLPIHVGYDWDNWTKYPSGEYEVTDTPIEGWREERRFPYLSRLSGFSTRYVLAESKQDAPPLTAP